MKVKHTLVKNRLCTNLLYLYIEINQFRDVVISGLINKIFQSKNLRGAAQNYLAVQNKWKEDMKVWLKQKFITDASLSCPLFVTHTLFWSNMVYKDKVMRFIQRSDVTYK